MVSRRHLEGKQKLREHHLGTMARVEAILELREGLGKMLGADVNKRASNAKLQAGP